MKINLRLILAGGLIFLLTGCSTSFVHRCGDARVRENRTHFALLATAGSNFEIEFPHVNLANQHQEIFRVRNAVGQTVPDRIYMRLSQGDYTDGTLRHCPWCRATVYLEFRTLLGEQISDQRFELGKLKWRIGKNGAHIFGWDAEAKLPLPLETLRPQKDYNVIVTIEKPSSRACDFIQLKGSPFNYYFPPARMPNALN